MTPDKRELHTLLGRMLDDALNAEQQARLEQLLQDRPELITDYVRFFRLSSELHKCLSRPEVSFLDPDLNLDIPDPPAPHVQAGRSNNHVQADQERIRRIRLKAEQQLQAFLAEQERQRKDAAVTSRQRVAKSRWDFGSLLSKADALVSLAGRSIVSLAACVALAILGFGIVHSILSGRVIATISQSTHALWQQSPDNNQLHRGRLSLLQGYAEIRFSHGARVLVQAPCHLTLLSPDRMSLEEGRVTATVPPEAIGFTIDTATSSIQDFGTEFGVGIDGQTQTEVHVYQGRVQLRMDRSSQSNSNQWDLTQDRAAILDDTGKLELTSVQERPNLFVRQLPGNNAIVAGQALSLADMIGRGNGLGTGLINHGMSLTNGQFVDANAIVRARANGFIPAPDHDFIDGVFIPDADAHSPLVVTSTGLTYAQCPDTSGLCVHMIRNGSLFQHEDQPAQPGRLQGQIYGQGGLPGIGMHANAGITFDLNRIRAIYPGSRITRFTSLAGISETAAQFTDGTWNGKRITVGFRVLIDGRERFSRDLRITPAQTVQIDLRLRDTDRFLTLITLEGHWDRPFAWSLFGDPMLELTPVKMKK